MISGQVPERILDAPDIMNDYYLNLVDWSCGNLLAVALGSFIYLWNAGTGEISQLCGLEGEEYVCSVRWVEEGTRGRILFTGSINGILSEPDHTAYDTSKGAVAAMVRSLCVTLAPLGIRVNALAPGLVRTPLTKILDENEQLHSWMKFHTPNGQVPNADVCGGAAVFLLSDAAEHVQGQTLLVDGGMSVWQQPDPPDNWPT